MRLRGPRPVPTRSAAVSTWTAPASALPRQRWEQPNGWGRGPGARIRRGVSHRRGGRRRRRHGERRQQPDARGRGGRGRGQGGGLRRQQVRHGILRDRGGRLAAAPTAAGARILQVIGIGRRGRELGDGRLDRGGHDDGRPRGGRGGGQQRGDGVLVGDDAGDAGGRDGLEQARLAALEGDDGDVGLGQAGGRGRVPGRGTAAAVVGQERGHGGLGADGLGVVAAAAAATVGAGGPVARGVQGEMRPRGGGGCAGCGWCPGRGRRGGPRCRRGLGAC